SYTGKIFFEEKEIKFENGSIQQAIEQGISIVYQELALIPSLTVGENVFLGREPMKGNHIDWDTLYSSTKKLLEKYKLDIPYSAIVGSLPMGKQQLVEIAKALSNNAKVLILDEPTSALSVPEVKTLMRILNLLRDSGITCIYISHKLDEIFTICDSVTVFRDGKVIDSLPITELSTDKLINLMVGRDMRERFPEREHHIGETILLVDNFWVDHPEIQNKQVTKGVSLDLKRGEVLGIAGLMGSGRSELVMSLFGEYGKVRSGEITIDGKKVLINSSSSAMKHGLSLVPEDRKKQGLILDNTILENIALPNLDLFSTPWKVDPVKELHMCTDYAKQLTIKAPNLHTKVTTLSGGNQQKVVISKWLMKKPKILILDDPTRGIDVGAKYEIYKLINNLVSSGVAIILISSEMEEVIGMSDRVLVMCEGQSMGILSRAEATQELIMKMAAGIVNKNNQEA
ncbi:MAG: sugar ABC transporter ATP-binding protein, partial [Spirochaetia bacterium]|nr:sugar ABC transporter ATP-binding protein [Spirochaetia bacterium]